MKPIIEQEWDDFWTAVKPANAPAVQRIEMRRAFFGGMRALLAKLSSLLDSEDAEPTPGDLLVMQQIDEELNDFCKAIEQGRA